MQPIEFFEANIDSLNPFQANVIKYVCRYPFKGGIADLEKAQHYLDILIAKWKKDHPATVTCTRPNTCKYCGKGFAHKDKIVTNGDQVSHVVCHDRLNPKH